MLPSPGGGSVGRFGLLALQLAVLGLLVAQQAAAQRWVRLQMGDVSGTATAGASRPCASCLLAARGVLAWLGGSTAAQTCTCSLDSATCWWHVGDRRALAGPSRLRSRLRRRCGISLRMLGGPCRAVP